VAGAVVSEGGVAAGGGAVAGVGGASVTVGGTPVVPGGARGVTEAGGSGQWGRGKGVLVEGDTALGGERRTGRGDFPRARHTEALVVLPLSTAKAGFVPRLHDARRAAPRHTQGVAAEGLRGTLVAPL